jgi:hypothetical protein
MHKHPIPIALDKPGAKGRRTTMRKAGLVLLGISLAPLIAEGSSICYAQWSQVMGNHTEASTPVLNRLHDGFQSSHRSFWGAILPYFNRVPWRHEFVLAAAAVVVVAGVTMLKM